MVQQGKTVRLNWLQRVSGSGSRASLSLVVVVLGVLVLATIYHYGIYVAQVDQPHRLTLVNDLFAYGVVGLVSLVCLVLGRPLLRSFKVEGFSRLEWNALAFGMGAGILSLSVFGLGLLHLLYPWLLAGGLALALALGWKEGWQIVTAVTNGKHYCRWAAVLPATPFERALAMLVGVEVLLLGSQALTLPYNVPYGYDLYQYHWALPKLYLWQHGIFAVPGWANADFPFTTEMLNTLALAVEAPEAALLLQAFFGGLAVLLLAGYLYRHVGSLAAWLGVALCFSMPLFTGVLVSGYAEPAMLLYIVASVLLLLAWLESTAQPWRLVILAGLFAGWGLGAKYQAGEMLAGGLLLLVCVAGLRAWRVHQSPEQRLVVLRRFLLATFLYGAAALLPLLPWLLRNWAFLGNPIYPALWNGLAWDAARSQIWGVTMGHYGPQGPFLWRLLTGFFGLFLNTTTAGEPPFTPPSYVLLGVLVWPVVLLSEWRISARQTSPAEQPAPPTTAGLAGPWVVLVSGAYLAWLLSQALLARYALVWLLLLVVPAAVVLARLCRPTPRWRVLRGVFQGLIVCGVLLCGPLFTVQYWLRANPVSLLAGQVSLRHWEEQHIMEPSYWAMIDYVNTQLPRDAKVLLVGRGAGYFLEGRDYVADSGEDWIPYLETEGHTAAGITAMLQQQGFRYLIYDEDTLQFVVQTFQNTTLARYLPPFRQFLASALIQVWSQENFHIYVVPPGPGS